MSDSETAIESHLCKCDVSGGGVLLFLQVAREDIVRFQALFESYEGIGTVRTMDKERAIIAILTTNDMVSTVESLLLSGDDFQEGSIPSWRRVSLSQAEKSNYLSQL